MVLVLVEVGLLGVQLVQGSNTSGFRSVQGGVIHGLRGSATSFRIVEAGVSSAYRLAHIRALLDDVCRKR